MSELVHTITEQFKVRTLAIGAQEKLLTRGDRQRRVLVFRCSCGLTAEPHVWAYHFTEATR